MPVLGHGGSLELRREAPPPVVLPSVTVNTSLNCITLTEQAYWTGDLIQLTCANGLPLHASSSTPAAGTQPDAPNGYAMYAGGVWFVGYNKTHISDDTDQYYNADNNNAFYATSTQTDFTTQTSFYIYRDQLDRISFHRTRAAALRGATNDRVALYKVDVGGIILSSTGNSTYTTALLTCANEIKYIDLISTPVEKLLSALSPSHSVLKDEDTANFNDWRIQALLANWTLNLSAPEVDTTALGERFGDSVKSLVTGGGTMDFLIEYADLSLSKNDTTVLMNLLLLTQKGCRASAKFYMFKDRTECANLLPGSLYYETDLMITSEAINTRADEIIAGSLDFVTVGSINLRIGTS